MHVTAPLFVSPRIAAEMLGYESIEPVYQAIREGRLPAKRFGSRTLRIKVADIESFGTPVEGDAA